MTAPTISTFRLSSLLSVKDVLEVSLVRLRAVALGRSHGFAAAALDRLGYVAEEMASNIVRHAGAGQIIMRAVGEVESGCIEILALDKGPGIGNMNRAMRDTPAVGVPSSNGLFNVKQSADLFDIFSQPSRGTAVVAHVSGCTTSDGSVCRCADAAAGGQLGIICVPVHGEEECGDAWAIEFLAGRTLVLVVDGLGHGPEAAVAAKVATTVFRDHLTGSIEAMMAKMDSAMHTTRGAAVSITEIDHVAHNARFWGVGNAEGRVINPEINRHTIPQNGIVGHNMPRLQSADVAWPAGGRLVMHSDGITSRWRADLYPGLLARHPALLAGVLFRDFSRPRDDATVLVVRDPPAMLA